MITVKNRLFPFYSGLLNDLFPKDLSDFNSPDYAQSQSTLPAVNIKDTDNAFEVYMAAPGMEKKDFIVNFENDVLSISAEKKEEKTEEEKGKYSRKEYSYSSFKRSFSVPRELVDSSKISASYLNGELKITVPKREEVKPQPAKTIEIE